MSDTSDTFYKQFESGLRLIHKPMTGIRSLSVGIWVGAGSAFEGETENGISHFIEHMLFKGTEKRTAFEIADAIDRLGAQVNAFTAKECTCFYTKSVDEHAENCFEILSDLFFNSQFDDKEAEKEKSVVCEEISMVEDTPEDVCHELLSVAMFDGHCLGQTILGTPETVRGFTKKDIRAYMKRRYTAPNTVIAVAGNLSAAAAEDLTRRYFAGKFTETAAAPWTRCLPAHTNKFLCKSKKIEQANLAVGFPSAPYDSKPTYPSMLFNNIFGGSMSARLFQKVREELGLAYSIYSYVSAYKHCGLFSIFCGANPANAEKAAAAIKGEIVKLLRDGIAPDEFARGKAQLKGGFILGQESTSSIMNVIGKTLLTTGEVFDTDARVARIDAVTPDEVREVYTNIFDFKQACAALVAPKEKDILGILLG
jgi:predicted Zn-dependent peptidase